MTRLLAFGPGALEIPEDPFRLDRVEPEAAPRRSLDARGIRAALDRPTASPPLGEIFRGSRRVLVVVSDGTRAAGSATFLPPLIERIRESSGASVRLMVASGLHRPPTDDEVEAIVGSEVAGRFEVFRHDPDDESRLAEVGRTTAGTPVRVSTSIGEHDRVILTGGVGFHYYAGFSGGRKAVVPGLAARETITRNHLRALTSDGQRHPAARAGRLRGNPVHRDMAEGASMVGAHLLVNSVMADGGGVERLFVGHWRRAHEAACRYVRSRRSVRLRPRSLVVASAGGHPTDLNLIQSHKAFEAGIGALRPGGVFILVASCREGAGHEDFMPMFRFDDESRMVQALREEFRVYRQTALAWFRKTQRCRLVLVSNLGDDVARRLGAEPAEDIHAAFRIALRHLPGGTRGWLLPHGARLLVEPTDEETA